MTRRHHPTQPRPAPLAPRTVAQLEQLAVQLEHALAAKAAAVATWRLHQGNCPHCATQDYLAITDPGCVRGDKMSTRAYAAHQRTEQLTAQRMLLRGEDPPRPAARLLTLWEA